MEHRSLPPEFESRRGHIWKLFHLRLRFITFGGRSAHLAYHMHKSGRKTSTINRSSSFCAHNGSALQRFVIPDGIVVTCCPLINHHIRSSSTCSRTTWRRHHLIFLFQLIHHLQKEKTFWKIYVDYCWWLTDKVI